jgi:4-amino-4-deoxy-L-arabinose transferase-like glycosyltransferase
MRSQRDDGRAGAPRFLRWALLALALAFVATYLAIAPARIAYPFELEWMEGACVDHVRRVLAGQPLYVAPSVDFVPFVYPPLYFWLSAALAKLTGIGFLPLRLLSFVSSLGCFALIFLMVRKQTRSALAGIAGAGLFAACYPISGFWYDIARVDMLSLVLLLGAIHLVQLDRRWPFHLLAGVLLAVAFLAKQIALAAALPVMLFALIFQRGRGLVFTATSLMLSAASALVLDHVSGGWYRYYVFDLPRQHEIDAAAAVGFWTSDMLAAVPIGLALAILGVARMWRTDRRSALLWGAVLIGAVGASWTGRAHSGGYNNVLIPGYAAISIVFALGVQAATQSANPRRGLLLSAVYLLCIAQFLRLAYDPRQQLPTAADRRAGEDLVAAMRAIPGDIYLPYHGYLPTLAGKRSYAHAMAIWDVARGRNERATAKLLSEITGAIRQQRFAAVIVDTEVFAQPDLENYYSLHPILFEDDVLYPVTGLRTRPKWLYLPLGGPQQQ